VEKAKNLGQVVKNEQLKRAMFDRLAADVTADLWHPEIRRPQCASPALRPFHWSCNLRNVFSGLNSSYRIEAAQRGLPAKMNYAITKMNWVYPGC
jgi:hypothetical protein